MFCSNCGSQIDEGMNFCTSCGAPLAEQPADQPMQAAPAAAAYAPDAAVSTARARRAKGGRGAKVAIIVLAIVAAAAVAVFVVAPHLGYDLVGSLGGDQDAAEISQLSSDPEAIELAQVSGEESGQFLAGLSEFQWNRDGGYYGYATSEELAQAEGDYYAAVSESGYGSSEASEKSEEVSKVLVDTGGSVYRAYADRGARCVSAQEVSNWQNISGFSRYRVVDVTDGKPGAEEVENLIRGFGGEHMVVWEGDSYLAAAYTVGDGILGTVRYYYDDKSDAAGRLDAAYYSQDDVSTVLAAIQAADSQGADGLKSYLISSYTDFENGGDVSIADDDDILYYE